MKENPLQDESEEVGVLPDDAQEVRRPNRSIVGSLIKISLIVFGIVIVCALATPTVIKCPKKMEMTQAISNSKQIYLVLMEFENDFGTFPDNETAAKQEYLHNWHGPYSNDYLGQLIAGGYTKSEEIFYAYDKRYGKRKPDDDISPPSEILQKGECGFSYVMVEENGKVRGLSYDDNGGLPILAAPLVDATGACEAKSYDWRGVYLRVNGSARNERLHRTNQQIKVNHKTLFETGADTVWGTDLKPVILLPKR